MVGDVVFIIYLIFISVSHSFPDITFGNISH